MLHLGCHLSIAEGWLAIGETARAIGADTFQFFSRNPRGGKSKDIDLAEIKKLREFLTVNNFAPILAHAPYTLNPCSAKPEIRELAKNFLRTDLATLEHLPHNLYVFHPGCHGGQGVEIGIEQIAAMLNAVLTASSTTTVLLETMAGKGSEIGANFTELKKIIERVDYAERLGVCWDTCHLYCAGYDIVNDLEGVLAEFARVVGLARLRAVHFNDSMMKFNSHKDRHECIGAGTLGLPALLRVINHPQLRHLPFFLETPQTDLSGYAAEIKMLRANFRA